jgi:transposase
MAKVRLDRWQGHLEAARESGVSLARYAREQGLSRHTLYAARRQARDQPREKASAHRHAADRSRPSLPMATAFVPVVAADRGAIKAGEGTHRRYPSPPEPTPALATMRLTAQLPNGVTLRLECGGRDPSWLSAMLETLGRCDVPAGR